MKKILSVVLALSLFGALFAGCGGREKKDISTAESIADLSGATIGAQTGTFHLQALDQIDGVVKKDYADFTGPFECVKFRRYRRLCCRGAHGV